MGSSELDAPGGASGGTTARWGAASPARQGCPSGGTRPRGAKPVAACRN